MEFNKTVETDGNLLPKSDAVNTLVVCKDGILLI